MQQPTQMIPVMPSFPPTNITTEQIQKCLDENKKLILAILDNQNLGKLAECAQYQALLQKNLMYLAAIADSQPQAAPSMPPAQLQMATHPAMQQQGGGGGFYMQHPQAQQQQGVFPQKMPLQFNNPPHQMQQHDQQQHQLHSHQQAIQGQMAMRSGGPYNNGMHPRHHPEAAAAAVGPTTALPTEARAGDKQESATAAAAQGGGGDGESSYLKGSEEGK